MQAVDMRKLMQQERAKAMGGAKELGPSFIYNLLQDLKPIDIIDFRDQAEYQQQHIRGALHFDINIELQGNHNSDLHRFLANAKDRALIIGSLQSRPDIHQTLTVTPNQRQSNYKKLYSIRGGYQAFSSQYPFLCTSDDQSSPTAFARWPTELLQNQLYLSGVINVKNQYQMNQLNIQHLINFSKFPERFPSLSYQHFPIDTEDLIDFQGIIQVIREAPKPVLVYDLNGINEAVVAAAVYFASLKNVPTELAYGYILQRRPEISPDANAFLQLQNHGKEGVYKPPPLPSIEALVKSMSARNL